MNDVVYALMITGRPGRQPFAQAAVESFRRQTYRNRVLVVVNDGDYGLDLSGVMGVEVTVPRGRTLGDLRNLALEAVPGGAVWVQWDDDDWRHPEALAWQRGFLGDELLGAQLGAQVQYAFALDAAWLVERPRGIEGTIMARHVGVRYPSLARGEDTVFRDALGRRGRVAVAPNPPRHYLRFIHGRNTWDEAHFGLKRRSVGERSVGREDALYLNDVLVAHEAYRKARFEEWGFES